MPREHVPGVDEGLDAARIRCSLERQRQGKNRGVEHQRVQSAQGLQLRSRSSIRLQLEHPIPCQPARACQSPSTPRSRRQNPLQLAPGYLFHRLTEHHRESSAGFRILQRVDASNAHSVTTIAVFLGRCSSRTRACLPALRSRRDVFAERGRLRFVRHASS